jgi:hypothetical protein
MAATRVGISPFNVETFAQALGWKPWPYSAGTYWKGSRFLDWQKGKRLLGLPNGELLFSAYDHHQQTNRWYPFPAPKTMQDAMNAVGSLGWLEE